MKKYGMATHLFVIAFFIVSLIGMNRMEAAEKTGEQLYKEHCSMCHPEGGNIINPKKTLQKKDLKENNINSAEDVMKIVRKPGPGMTTFDPKLLSDKDARKIADYIFKNINK